MSEPSRDTERERSALRDQIIGLGAKSLRKSYYPQLQKQIEELEAAKGALEEKSESLMRTLTDLERARQQAEESERRFRTLFEKISDGVVVGRLDTYRLVMVNPAYCRMIGCTEQEVLSMSMGDAHPPEAFPRVREMMACLNRHGSVMVNEMPYKRKDGAIIFLDLNLNVIEMDHERLALGMCRDVTESKLARQALVREEVFNNAILNGVPGLLYFYNEKGELLRWNKQHEVMTGYSREELARMRLEDWYSAGEDTKNRLLSMVEKCFREGYAEADAWILTKRGAKILFHFTAVRLEIDGERYFVGIGIDITEQRRAENELRRLTRLYAVLSHVNQAVVHASSHSELLREVCRISVELGGFNLVWVGKVNWETKEVIPVASWGAKRAIIEELKIYADDRPEGRGIVGLSLREGRPRVANDFMRDVATVAWSDQAKRAGTRACLSLPLRNEGRIYGALVVDSAELNVFQDREIELLNEVASEVSYALDHLNQELRRKRDEAALKKAKEDAEAANQAKDQFIAVLSHELRTPLTPVLTAVALLQSREGVSGELKMGLDVIKRNAELEARLIDDLLDVTRVSRGLVQLRREEVDAHAAIAKTLEICQGEIEQKQMVMEVSLKAREPYVWADSARLQQVLWNLVKNAIKFTPAGGRVSIATGNVDHRLKIEVADTGIGISPEAVPRIFNAFEQGEKTWTRRFGGLGLGLSIAKAIVDLHGGRLSAHSRGPGMGSVFTVELDTITPRRGSREEGRAVEPRAAGRWRVLLVEDHVDTLRILSRLLGKWGYEVRGAGSVAEALALAANEPFDVLISDIGLPDGSGLELMRAVRRKSRMRGIAISGFGTDEDIRQSRAAGFDEHLTKPVEIEGLHAAVERVAPLGKPS